MGIFRQFPYTNFHEINLDEIIKIMREMQDEWTATKNEWASYKDFIDNYFETLDVSEEVLEALRVMAGDGSLNDIMDPVIAAAVTEWLEDNITPTTPAIDATLSIADAAADAKAVGVALSAIYASNGVMEWDYANKLLTVPAGFVLFKGEEWSVSPQTIDCSQVATTYDAWRVKYHHNEVSIANRYFYVEAWNAAGGSTDPIIGYIYQKNAKINNLFGSDYSSTMGIWLTQHNEYITFDRDNMLITYPQSAIYAGGIGISITAGSIDLTLYPSPGNARCIYYLVSTSSFIARTFNQAPPSDAILVGYQYADKLVINGSNTYDIAKFAMIINPANAGNNYYYYNKSTKQLTFKAGGFCYTSDGKYFNIPEQVADFSAITTSAEAYQIILLPNGTVTARNWNNTTEFNGWLIGLIYGSTVTIFSQLPVISSDRHIAVFGDSLASAAGCNRPFHLILAKVTECIFNNYAVGSSGFVANASGSVVAGQGGVGKGVTITASGTNNVPAIISNTTGYDGCVILAGTNDFGASVALTTFRTAVANALDTALAVTSNILVITPPKRETYNVANNVGAVLEDYVDIIIDECESRSIVYVDAFRNLNVDATIANHKTRFMPDGLHLNDVGQNMLAGLVAPEAMASLAILQ